MKNISSPPDLSKGNPLPPATESQTQDEGESLWRECLLGSLERMRSVRLPDDAADEGLFDILNDVEYQPSLKL